MSSSTAHVAKLLEQRKGAVGPRRKDRIAALSDEARVYLQEVARRRIDLENEVKKLTRLLAQYGPADLAEGIARALAARTFGARYVRTCIDQARFARGLAEPPEPIVTGNAAAERLGVPSEGRAPPRARRQLHLPTGDNYTSPS